jgi:hypothetical protein
MLTYTTGERVRWVGRAGQFSHNAVIVRAYRAYLAIFGEDPDEDGRLVCDIHDLTLKAVVYAVPADQLHA